MSRPPTRAAGLLVAAAALLAGCSAGSGLSRPDPAGQVPPPAPPAACLLDTVGLGATTGLTWTPDATAATDTRCVYDPAGVAVTQDGPAFLAVDVAPARGGDAATELDDVAGVCDEGSRAPVAAGEGGFVCRLQGGSVFAATVRGGQLVTVAASAVPAGTSAARLVVELGRQIATLGP